MLRPLLGLLVAATMVPVAAATTDPFAPSSVVIFKDLIGTTLSWTQGPEPADSYRVYGLSTDSVATFIVEIPADGAGAWFASNLPAFPNYGVSGVQDGAESDIQPAKGVMLENANGCVRIAYEPPPPVITTQCGPYIGPIPPHIMGRVNVPSPENAFR